MHSIVHSTPVFGGDWIRCMHIHSQKKLYYYSYIGSYLKAVRAIAEIWNSMLCFTVVLKPQLQPEVANVHTITIYIQYKVRSILKSAVSAVK